MSGPDENQKLTINSVTDCTILINAVRSYCGEVGGEYMKESLRCAQAGNTRTAQRTSQLSREMTDCAKRTVSQLQAIRKYLMLRDKAQTKSQDPGADSGDESSDTTSTVS